MNKEKAAVPALLKIIKAALIACALGVALVALCALFLQKQWLDIGSLPYINIAIKLVSAASAACIACIKAKDKALIRGMAAAACYMLLSFVIFSLISGGFELNTALLSDVLICAGAGAIVGILHNLRT